MKPAACRMFVLAALLWVQFVSAQDIQELYDTAKQALLNGDYQTALDKVTQGREQIANDPNLDPNGLFMEKLLPKVENAANAVASITRALEELYNSTQAGLFFPDLPPSSEAVDQYTQQAKSASMELIAKRDSILASYELDPEFRDALRNTPAFKQVEQLASAGIVEKLSGKFAAISLVLTDSIKAINSRYEALQTNLQKMKKAATASATERKKMEKQIADLSAERINYMNAISEMLVGEAVTSESQPARMALVDQNLDNVFSNVILSEISRVEQITEVDSAGHKELLKNYERIKKYNQIFSKNNVTGDQATLLAQYESAIKRVKVRQPGNYRFLLYSAIVVVVGILIFAVYKISSASKKGKAAGVPPKDTGMSPPDKKA
jgi:hypothetical protein